LCATIQQLQTQPNLAPRHHRRGTTFVASADLREFVQPLQDPQIPPVIA